MRNKSVVDLEGVQQVLRAMMPELQERYGVKSLGVFGSYATGRQKSAATWTCWSSSIGSRCRHRVNEIRIRETSGAYRVIYVAKFADTVYVLHCFHKKTQKTSRPDLTLAESRYRELVEELSNERK